MFEKPSVTCCKLYWDSPHAILKSATDNIWQEELDSIFSCFKHPKGVKFFSAFVNSRFQHSYRFSISQEILQSL